MRLSKTALTFLAIGILVVLSASLLMAYFQEGQEQDRLSQELSAVQLLLAKQWVKFSSEEFPSQQSELESRLALAESQINSAKVNLRQSLESIEITDAFFEIAEANEVKIVEIGEVEIVETSPPGWPEEDTDEISFSAMTLTAKIEGDVPNLVNFISELSERFPTSVYELTEIAIPEVAVEEEEVEQPSATLKLYIHTYEGN